MRFNAFVAVTFTAASAALGNSYSWTPSDSDLNDLDHHYAYEWGIKWTVPTGETITGATLKFQRIWDWTVEQDRLYINLLDTPSFAFPSGSNNEWRQVQDNYNDTLNGNAFQNVAAKVLLATWHDPNGGNNGANAVNLTYDLSNIAGVSYLGTLQSYLSDGKMAWGLDPDCHYYNDGITFTITTTSTSQTPPVPDGGSTMMLLGCALMGLEGCRRRFTR